MANPKLIRITTVLNSIEKLLSGKLGYMQELFEITAISADEEQLKALGKKQGYKTYNMGMTRQSTLMADLISVLKLYKYLKTEKPSIVYPTPLRRKLWECWELDWFYTYNTVENK